MRMLRQICQEGSKKGGFGGGEHLIGGRPLLFLGGEGVAGGGVNTIEGEVTR